MIPWHSAENVPAVAPKAMALRTSVARLTPPSTNSWNFSLGNFNPLFSPSLATTSTRTSIPDRAKSSWRPPWFERTTPARPASYAMRTSYNLRSVGRKSESTAICTSQHWTPLRIRGTGLDVSDAGCNNSENALFVMLLNQSMSAHSRPGSMKDYECKCLRMSRQVISVPRTVIARAAPWERSTHSDPALVTSDGSSASNFMRIS